MATSTITRDNSFQSSLTIPSNSDLNDYTTPGAYYVGNSSTAATISHSPVTGSGYVLLVLRLGNLCYQMIVVSSRIFTRNLGSSAWGNWYKFTGETV